STARSADPSQPANSGECKGIGLLRKPSAGRKRQYQRMPARQWGLDLTFCPNRITTDRSGRGAVVNPNDTGLQWWGAFAFGALMGWNLYFLNRYRTAIALADLASIIGALGGAAVLALFPAKSVLFGAYGLGLFAGFFLYFL